MNILNVGFGTRFTSFRFHITADKKEIKDSPNSPIGELLLFTKRQGRNQKIHNGGEKINDIGKR